MRNKYFDLFIGQEKTIIIKDENDKDYSPRVKSTFVYKPNFFKKCGLDNKKSLDFSSVNQNLNKSTGRPIIQKHGFFNGTKKMLAVLIVFCTFFVFSSGISIGIQKKKEISNIGQLALSKLQDGMDKSVDGNYNEAVNSFEEAEDYFYDAQEIIRPFLYNTSNLFEFTGDFEAADNALKLGIEISNATSNFLKLAGELKNLNSNLTLETNYLEIADKIFSMNQSIIGNLLAAKAYLNNAKGAFVMSEYADKLDLVGEIIDKLLALTNNFQEHSSAVKILLGDKHPHTILFLFQNSHEIRANGGFIGSLFFVTFNDGKIASTEFKDVYDFDSQLPDGIEPPEPFKKIAENWGLRDANYYPNFPDSAKKIRWFLEKEKGNSVDTIIALDEQMIEKFLEKTGEIPLTGTQEFVSSENFSILLSFFVEAKIFGENTPKKILANFLPSFFDNLKKLTTKDILMIFGEAVSEKHFLAFSFNEKLQNMFEDFGMSGEVIANEKIDNLAVVQTSISANKSDGFIDEKITHKTFLNLDGEIFDKVNITRSHNWGDKEEEFFKNIFSKYGATSLRDKEALKFILGSGENQVWTRVYVPKNSKITKVEGLDLKDVKISEENNLTVFSFFYPVIAKGQSAEVTISYVPYKLIDSEKNFNNYHFCFIKSAGIAKNTFQKELLLEDGLEVAESSEPMPFNSEQKTDQCFDFLIKR